MTDRNHNTTIALDCKVDSQENLYPIAGTFPCRLFVPFDVHELDQIEAKIANAGQEFKRQFTKQVLEEADRRIAQVAQAANPKLHKHDSRPFTIVARYGEVRFHFQGRRVNVLVA